MEQGKRRRLATLVGCNYAHTPHQLHGCINDVRAMQRTLVDLFGFGPDDIVVLTDEPGSVLMPTGANIKRVLGAMIDRAEPGDVLFFHYSGHGTTVPAIVPHGGAGRDEAIVPCDFNLITDVDFRELVNRLPPGSTLTIVSDSCHSGGLINEEKEQIGPTASPTASRRPATRSRRAKHIPHEALLSHLSALSGLDSAHVADHLSGLFGPEMTHKYLPAAGPGGSAGPDEGILLSGCQADETSADMYAGGGAAEAYGAFSNALETVMREAGTTAALSNREVVARARAVLLRQGFGQHPCLYCSDENADAPFLRRKPVISGRKKKERKGLQKLLLQSSI